MKYLVILLACFLTCYLGTAQTLELKGQIKFKVQAPAKEIVGSSADFTLNLDRKNGTATFTVPVRSFLFNNNFSSDTLNERLKNRFNDYYMESDRYPMITFSSQLQGLQLNKDGRYTKQGKGRLTVHGVTKEIEFNCDIEVHNKQVSVQVTTVFIPAYFNIRIPAYISDFYFRKVEIGLQATGNL